MRVSFIGQGNVATQMAARLRALGAEIVDVCSRTGKPVEQLRADDIDLVVVAVSDDAIPEVLAAVPSAGRALWVHTAGSVGLDVFDTKKFPRCGVLYPLQTMLKNSDADWSNVPLLVEGDPAVEEIALQMSPKVAHLDSVSRRRLHAAAVIGCNMVMYLWSLCEQITREANLPFEMLMPLLEMTLQRAHQMDPADAITGPARRGDLQTLNKHIHALPADIADLYRFISNKMLQKYHPDLSL